ncbi:MAG: hypothetical protein Q3M24_04335 [Candidatus Electrothrix aestuarii]|uniref:Uncharacterized protein n=1 Tax=Candidatus Electrothrix aestuarii TaxID=3062594 RepID=A0AAU8LXS5_9BACT
MKGSAPVLFFCAVLCLTGCLFIFPLQKDKMVLAKASQEPIQPIHKTSLSLYSAGADFLDTPFIRAFTSLDCSKISTFFTKGIGQQLQTHAQSLAPQELISHHAMAVLELPNAAAVGQSFLDSRFGKTLNDIKWHTILQRLKIKRSLSQPLARSSSSLMHLLTHASFSQVFSRRLFLAQLPALPSLFGEEQRHPLMENQLFILDPGQDDPEKLLSTLLTIPQGRQNSLKYLGLTIHTFRSKRKPTLYIAKVGDKIILSFAPKSMKESISLYLNHLFQRPNNLLLNQEYRGLAEQKTKETDFFFYADLFRLKLHFSLLFAQLGSQKSSQKTLNRPWAAGVRSLGMYHQRNNKTDELKTLVRFSQEQLDPFQRHIYSTPPSLSQSFQEVPADLVLAFWFNWLEPRLWWKTTAAHGEKEERASADRIAAWIKQKTDMSMEQFLGLFGKNFSVYVAEVSTAGFFPVPRLCLSIEIHDRHKVEAFLQEIIANLPTRRTMIGGVPVVSLLAAQGMLQPSYTFFNGKLLIADSREQVEDILLRKKKPLAAGKEFQGVDTNLAKPANLHLFARIPELVNALQELASWAGTMIAVRDHRSGSTSKVLVDQVLTPILESFNTYRAIGIRSATAPNELIIDTKILRTQATTP